MSPIVVLLIVFAITMFLGVPIVWSLGISSFLTLVTMGDVPLMFLAQRMFTGAEKYSLLAIFFFMVAGSIMQNGGISRRLVRLANSFFGHINGGLSIVAIVTSMFFAAISGSSIATTAAIGAMLYPELVKREYPKSYAAALPVVGGTLGIVIPPSIVFVVYGTCTNTSISDLLISGIIPGVLGGIAMAIYAYIYARVKHIPKSGSFSLKEVVAATKDAFFAIIMPVIILGGIYMGVFTPTESAAVAVAYGLIVSAFIYKEISWIVLKKIIIESTKATANIMLLVMSATIFGWLLTVNNVPAMLTELITSLISTKVMFLLALNLLLLILGMFMDNGAIILIVAPLVYPIAMSYGVDPILLGCITVFNLAIGQATPPFGTCLFMASSTTKEDVILIAKECIPFIIVLIGVLLVVTFIPSLATYLPSMMKG